MTYDELEKIADLSKRMCSPEEYYLRQANLLQAVADYILEKDKPSYDEEDE